MNNEVFKCLQEIKLSSNGDSIFNDKQRFKAAILDFMPGTGQDITRLRNRVIEVFEFGVCDCLKKSIPTKEITKKLVEEIHIDEMFAQGVVEVFEYLLTGKVEKSVKQNISSAIIDNVKNEKNKKNILSYVICFTIGLFVGLGILATSIIFSRNLNDDESFIIEVLVSFDSSGGTVSKQRIVTIGEIYGLHGALGIPFRSGYSFSGWFDENGARIINSTVVTATDDHTLTAGWSANEIIVLFDSAGGSDVRRKIVTFGEIYGINGTLSTPSRMGYSFQGWFDENGTQINSTSIVTATDDHTLTAKWLEILD
jgi:uncharacterized repeat protein (TIGR02543 family)